MLALGVSQFCFWIKNSSTLVLCSPRRTTDSLWKKLWQRHRYWIFFIYQRSFIDFFFFFEEGLLRTDCVLLNPWRVFFLSETGIFVLVSIVWTCLDQTCTKSPGWGQRVAGKYLYLLKDLKMELFSWQLSGNEKQMICWSLQIQAGV